MLNYWVLNYLVLNYYFGHFDQVLNYLVLNYYFGQKSVKLLKNNVKLLRCPQQARKFGDFEDQIGVLNC